VVEQLIGTLLLLLILFLVLAQVAQRYTPGTWPWTGELARYSMVWAAFLMAGYLVAYPPHHIAIHVVDFVAKGRVLAAIKMFVNVVILLTVIVVAYGGVSLVAQDIGQVTAAGQMPLKYVNAVPIVGMLLVGARAILGIVVTDLPALRARGEKEEELA
jgi:TRAP-type C4-dicarboxylate transport system permease small subunit